MNWPTKIYLRGDNKQAVLDALQAAGYTDDEGNPTDSHTRRIVMLGALSERTGNMLTDGDGFEYPEYQPIPGYHANLWFAEGVTPPAELDAVRVEVSSPSVHWAEEPAA